MSTPKTLQSARNYTIGWVAALDHELTAATSMFDEEHDFPEDFKKHPRDTNQYFLGKIGQHNVVIASLAAGEYGAVPAATTASNMCSSFPHIRVGLMVGIGAGLPKVEENKVLKGYDIRLGDVVVSEPKGIQSGVVQYDLGKEKSDEQAPPSKRRRTTLGSVPTGHFERVGFLSAPPEVLRKGLSSLKMKHRRKGTDIPQILEEMLQKYPRLGEADPDTESPAFVHQGAQNDRLFDPLSRHVETCDSDKACSGCDPSSEIARLARSSDHPRIHYGIIASGNSVIKSGMARETILQRLPDDCLCFEMEAAGLMNHFPCLVIRGICDYTDSHKNDRWQNYAAAVAAAFTKELLQTLQPQEVESEQPVKEILHQIQFETSQTFGIVDHLEKDQEEQRMLKWLDATDPSANFIAAAKHLENSPTSTGTWFLQGKVFQKWKSGSLPQLWLRGIPGCGKTVLSSLIIRNLSERCLYYFFDINDSKKLSHDSLIRSLLRQARALRNPEALERFKMLFSECGEGEKQPETPQLVETLVHMLRSIGLTEIIVDALDESTQKKEVLSSLARLVKEHGELHLIFTSRPLESIRTELLDWIPKEAVVPADGKSVDKDIKHFIQMKLSEGDQFKDWRSFPDQSWRTKVEATLTKKSGGMFRWTALQLDALAECRSIRVLEETLESLHEGLHRTYDRIIEKIPPTYKRNAFQLLQFLVFSEKGLDIDEAIEVMAVDLERNQPFEVQNRVRGFKDISDVLPGLVTVQATKKRRSDKIRQKLNLAHATVKEYFLSKQFSQSFDNSFSEVIAKTTIIQVFLCYLSGVAAIYSRENGSLGEEAEFDNTIRREIRRKFPFARTVIWLFDVERAGTSVLHYLEHGAVRANVESSMTAFLVDKPPGFVFLKNFHSFGTSSPFYELVFAIRGKFQNCVQLLVDRCLSENSLRPPLYFACRYGNIDAVQLLLDRGANPRTQNPLRIACEYGHLDVVQLLLDRGASIQTKGLLTIACEYGYLDVVLLLLDRGAGITDRILYAACRNGVDAARRMVELLLRHGIGDGCSSKPLKGALSMACFNRNISAVQLVLEQDGVTDDIVEEARKEHSTSSGFFPSWRRGEWEHIMQMLEERTRRSRTTKDEPST